MTRSSKILLGLAVAGVAVLVFLAFQPGPSYDTSRVDARLLALPSPYQSVKTFYFADGGSIGIEIIGRDGKREQFAMPAHLGETNRYSKVFVGALHDRKPGAVEISEPEHTKRMLICILRDSPHRTPHDDFCLMALRRYPVDIARAFYHKLAGHYAVEGASNNSIQRTGANAPVADLRRWAK